MTKNEFNGDITSQGHVKQQTTTIVVPPDVPPTTFANTQSDPRPLLVLVNPHSGRGKSLRVFKKYVTNFFDSHRINYEVFVTKADFRVKDYLSPKSLDELMCYRAFIVVSGDGLVFEVVNAIMTRPDWKQIMTIPIGVIPTGSGNGLAHTLIAQSEAQVKNQTEAVKICCQQAVLSETCSSDLVKITYDDDRTIIWSFLSIGWGLLANIDVDSDWMRRIGEFRFTVYGLLRSLTSVSYKGRLSYKPITHLDQDLSQSSQQESNSNGAICHQIQKEPPNSSMESGTIAADRDRVIDDTNADEDGWIHIEDKFACLYAVHQSHISKKTKFAPNSTPADALIYLTYIRGRLSPCQVIRFLLAIDDGSHDRLPFVKVEPVRKFRFQPLEPGKIVVDGEKITWDVSHGPLTAEVVPEAMKLLWSNRL